MAFDEVPPPRGADGLLLLGRPVRGAARLPAVAARAARRCRRPAGGLRRRRLDPAAAGAGRPFTSRSTEVDGTPATLLETRDRILAAVVWVDDGVVTLVAGSLDDDEVLAVARELG
jgi:hypothetical protein